ncbi:MAG TPA: 3'-5' exonuclease, partial [Candidatus Hydrogenedentes bacterium]|nr:3'-5' exonuclease [Candidatus Hydrogenedentota bacterium]
LRLARCGGLGAAFDQGIEPEDLGQTAEWRRARALLDKLRGELARPLLDLLRRVLEETGYEALLLNQFLGLQKASNVRKLVDLADNFTRTRPATPRAFIAYIREVRDQAVREGEAPMQPEGAGAVTIMTVHKAKGLEFPVVFLPDTSSVPRGSNRPAVPLHRELGIAVSVTGDDGERTAPALGEAVRRRQVEEEAAEHARVLYVAMTRARDCLVLSGAPDPRKGSWLELLDAHFGVTGQRDGAVIDARESRAGRPCHAGEGWSVRVRRTVPRKRAKAEKKKRVALPALDEVKRMVAPLTGVVSARHRFSVSGILNAMAGLWSDEAPGHESAGGVATVTPGRLNPLVRGSLVHRMFELWDFAAPPDTTALLREAEVSRRLWPEVAADLRGVAERFQALPLADRLRRDDGLLRETPFSIRLDEVLINGTIDALLSDGTIIDYKTGVVRDAAQARYEWQLLLYAAALRRLRGVTPDRGILCYVDSGHVHEVALGADEVALAERHALEAVDRLRGVAPSLEDVVELPGDA